MKKANLKVIFRNICSFAKLTCVQAYAYEGFCSRSMLRDHFARVRKHEGACLQNMSPVCRPLKNQRQNNPQFQCCCTEECLRFKIEMNNEPMKTRHWLSHDSSVVVNQDGGLEGRSYWGNFHKKSWFKSTTITVCYVMGITGTKIVERKLPKRRPWPEGACLSSQHVPYS